MGWPELMIFGGVFTGLAGLVLTIHQVLRRQSGREQPRPRSAHYVEEIGVLVCQTLVFGGMALTTLGNIAAHIRDKTLPTNLWLSFLGGMGALLLFGVQSGRLLMRWQVGRLLAEFDAGNGETTPSP